MEKLSEKVNTSSIVNFEKMIEDRDTVNKDYDVVQNELAVTKVGLGVVVGSSIAILNKSLMIDSLVYNVIDKPSFSTYSYIKVTGCLCVLKDLANRCINMVHLYS